MILISITGLFLGSLDIQLCRFGLRIVIGKYMWLSDQLRGTIVHRFLTSMVGSKAVLGELVSAVDPSFTYGWTSDGG